jgi:hypothetical protein
MSEHADGDNVNCAPCPVSIAEQMMVTFAPVAQTMAS